MKYELFHMTRKTPNPKINKRKEKVETNIISATTKDMKAET